MNLHDIERLNKSDDDVFTPERLRRLMAAVENAPITDYYMDHYTDTRTFNTNRVYYHTPTDTYENWRTLTNDGYYAYDVRGTAPLPNRVDGVFLGTET